MNQNEANFIRVRLGDIRPNRFRDLKRWPVEPDVIEKLKQSIHETGFWNNLQATRNEQGQIELRFGHHRLAAGLELFGPDHEVMLEIVPFEGEWNLLRALYMENAVKRNSIAHLHEIVSRLVHWWDDEIFERYPTWAEIKAAKFSSFNIEEYFGGDGESGVRAYARCVKYGIGREVLARMLENESRAAIEQALLNLPPTERHKRGAAIRLEEQRREAEKQREEAERLRAEMEARDKAAAEAEKLHQEEVAWLKQEKRKARRDTEKQAQLEAQLKEQVEAHFKKQAECQSEARNAWQAVSEAEVKARKAQASAEQQKKKIETSAWFDPRAAEVFDCPAHGAAFRQAVSQDHVRSHLGTADLLPFAQQIRAELERREQSSGREALTAPNIQNLVLANFRQFQDEHRLKEQAQQQKEQNNPTRRLAQKVSAATEDLFRAHRSLDTLLKEIYEQKITAHKLNSVAFINSVADMRRGLAELYRYGISPQRALDQSPAALWDIPPTVDEGFQQLIENLPITDRDDAKTAWDTLIAQLKQDFQAHVEQEGVRRQREAIKQMGEWMGHESTKRTERIDAMRNKMAGKPVPYLTDEQFKLIRGLLHPDRHPDEEQGRYNQAFHLFSGVEDTVVLKPDTAQAMDWAKAMGL